jgi:hypothetical protein
MDTLPPEERALVAEYYARLRKNAAADIDTEILNFEAAIWEIIGPLNSEDPAERAFAKGKLNDLKDYAQSVGAGGREHCLASLPAAVIGLLIGCMYLVLEHFVLTNPSSSWGLLYAMAWQLAFCFLVLEAALRVLWPTEGYRTRIVLAVKRIRSYFSTDFRLKEFIPDFLVTGLYLYLVFLCAFMLACLITHGSLIFFRVSKISMG